MRPSVNVALPHLVLLLAAASACPCLHGQDSERPGDWPQWRGRNRDGISEEGGWPAAWPAQGPKVLWKRSVGTGYAAVSVVGSRIFTMGNDGRNDIVWCLDAATGAEVWNYSYPCRGGGSGWPGARIQPLIDGNRLYTLSLKGHIHCLDAETGRVIWSQDAARELNAKGGRHGFSCHPLIEGDRIIFELGARGGSIVAFNKANGRVIWQAGGDACGHSSPVLFGDGDSRCVLIWTGAGLIGMDLRDGRTLWRFPSRIKHNCNIATPVVSGDRVFISSVYYDRGSALLRFSRGKPVVLWHSKAMQNHTGTCVLWRDHLYGFDGWVDAKKGGKGVLKCVNFKTGQVRWAKKGLGTGSLVLAGGRLVILSGRGELIVAQASTEGFRELARAKVLDGRCWTMPVLSRGRIYCRNYEGDLICLDLNRK